MKLRQFTHGSIAAAILSAGLLVGITPEAAQADRVVNGGTIKTFSDCDLYGKSLETHVGVTSQTGWVTQWVQIYTFVYSYADRQWYKVGDDQIIAGPTPNAMSTVPNNLAGVPTDRYLVKSKVYFWRNGYWAGPYWDDSRYQQRRPGTSWYASSTCIV